MRLQELEHYLDDYLSTRTLPDYRDAYNGLQVSGPEYIERVVLAVDACQATIDRTADIGADLMIVHHGLFWGARPPVTGRYYRRLAALIKHDIALYACHLPLDAHPEVGNNHVLTRRLGLKPTGMFGEFEGVAIGVYAYTEMGREQFVAKIREALQVDPLVIPTGPETVRTVGILTGGGGSYIPAAAAAGVDTFVTGEGAHHTYFDAEELGLNIVYAGHYATETVGVKALGDHLAQRFGLECEFIGHPTGL